MDRFWLSRRRMLASAVGIGLGLAAPAVTPAEDPTQSPEEPFPKDAKEAQRRLIGGNKRSFAGQSIHPRATEWRQRLTRSQKPFAAVLGCSDSRIPGPTDTLTASIHRDIVISLTQYSCGRSVVKEVVVAPGAARVNGPYSPGLAIGEWDLPIGPGWIPG